MPKKLRWVAAIMLGVLLIGGLISTYGVSAKAELWVPGEESQCGSAHPVAVTIRNWTPWEIKYVRANVEIWRGDKAINILKDSPYQGYEFPYLVPPLRSTTYCMSDSIFERLRRTGNTNKGKFSAVEFIRDANYFMRQYTEFTHNLRADVELIEVRFR